MPHRSRVSIASGTGSSTRYDDKQPTQIKECDPSEKFALNTASPTPLTKSALSASILPAPVLSSGSSSRKGKAKKSARISGGLRVHFERLRRRMGTVTAPSTSSNLDGSTTGDSSGYNRSRMGNIHDDPDEPVDEVVVDREWADDIKSSSVTHSEHGLAEKMGSNHLGGTNTDRESLAIHADGYWGKSTVLIWLRWRFWPMICAFFATRFLDEESEAHYNKESWYYRKSLAIFSSLFLTANWVLAVCFIPKPVVLADEIFYYGITPAFSLPIILMVCFDWPQTQPVFYQIYLSLSIWMWGVYQLIFINLCGHYGNRSLFTCGGKDFLTTFYYTSALQTIALFGLKLHRFPATVGAVIFFGLSFGLIVPVHHIFVRNIINFVAFQAFLLYVHYMRESAERRLYTLRDQLKIQFRATQKAQVNERKAADSKRRLTSYVFHDEYFCAVRVPLNTALLAVQNMEASGTIGKSQEIEFKALEGSLSMMSKVLNDVLDFNRMDSGKFESVLRPYSFHQVMRSLFVPLKLATDSRNMQFITDLDNNIDIVARRALYQALGYSGEEISKRLAESPDEDGIVVGDETRLRQIVTNLASNACKFTLTGGRLIISTKLILPHVLTKEELENGDAPQDSPELPSANEPNGNGVESPTDHSALSTNHLRKHNSMHSKPSPLEWIVVRMEVTDTGCGIRAKDMVQTKLFSAFNQTEQGRQQGGKGTGLGLALVRQIVKLSGGRLGVQSKANVGSTFWVELPLGIGNKAIPGLTATSSSPSDTTMDVRSLREAIRPRSKRASSPMKVMLTPDSQRTMGSQSSSAMHSIMEQGGLVEMSTRRGESSVPTRTLGDPYTGTEPILSPPAEEPAPTPSPSDQLPHPISESSTETIKPQHLKLPKPQRFSLDDSIPDVSPSGSAASHHASTMVSSAGVSAGYDVGIRVLVVDDDPLTRKLMSRMLTRLGCKVWTAENGEIALELILGTGNRPTPSSEDTGSRGLMMEGMNDEYRFSVVFLDNQMPVLSGLEAVAKLRAMGRRDFVVGVTGNALLTDQQEYLEAGVDHVLTKPVYEKSLKTMLAIADDLRKRGTPASERAVPLLSFAASSPNS